MPAFRLHSSCKAGFQLKYLQCPVSVRKLKTGPVPPKSVMSHSPGSSQESASSMTSSSTVDGNFFSLDFSKQCFQNASYAHLALLVQPETHFRYRYDTEMSGAHGSLQAERGGRDKQIPTVQLLGYSGPAVVRVSLATCNSGARYPHPHHLFVREKFYLRRYRNLDGKELYKTGHYIDPHYIIVSDSNYIAKFDGMCIISSKKEQFQRVIKGKLLQRGHQDDLDLTEYVQRALKHVDIAYVCLCFEAFRFDDGIIGEPICPPLYSDPIANAKNASSGKLKITRINKCCGSCQGGDAIWLLVEKINKKGLVVRFFEETLDGSIVWESVVEGDKLELHYQYAVIFQTPPYRDQDITRDVKVSMRLERRVVPFDFSEAETFVYEPSKQQLPKSDTIYRKESMFITGLPNKRPIADLIPPYMVPSKRRTEELIPVDAYAAFPYNYHKDNDKEFESILRDLFQLDGVVEMDGPVDDRQRVLLRVLKALVARAQLRDGDIKAVTEKVGQLFLRPDDLKLQDAASTLLSLRSGGLTLKAVHEAVLSGDVSEVEKALKLGGNAAELNELGQTPLHVALERGDIACVNRLLEEKSAVHWINIRDKQGRTALHIAIANQNLEAVSAIIASGGNANMDDEFNGHSALYMAVDTKHPEIIQCVMDKFDRNVHREGNDESSSEQLVEEASRLISEASRFTEQKPKGTIDKIAEVLNGSGKWENLFVLWELPTVVGADAAKAENPAKFLLNYVQEKQGLDFDALRNLLDALDEKEAVSIIDETLAKRFL